MVRIVQWSARKVPTQRTFPKNICDDGLVLFDQITELSPNPLRLGRAIWPEGMSPFLQRWYVTDAVISAQAMNPKWNAAILALRAAKNWALEPSITKSAAADAAVVELDAYTNSIFHRTPTARLDFHQHAAAAVCGRAAHAAGLNPTYNSQATEIFGSACQAGLESVSRTEPDPDGDMTYERARILSQNRLLLLRELQLLLPDPALVLERVYPLTVSGN